MLKRHSIRTKLKVSLALLSAIVLVLAFSGFWGLNRYGQLAESVSQRASEIPRANDLNRLALKLQKSNALMGELHQHEGMIDTTSLDDPLIDLRKLEGFEFDSSDGLILKSACSVMKMPCARQRKTTHY